MKKNKICRINLSYRDRLSPEITVHLSNGEILSCDSFFALRQSEGGSLEEAQAELSRTMGGRLQSVPTEVATDRGTHSGIVLLDTVIPEPVNWLWQNHIPLGKLTIIDGDPGLGKSTVTLDLVARVSQGTSMPDGSPGVSGGAVLLTLEDGLADTIVPRLNAAGADLTRIVALQSVQDKVGNLRFPNVKDTEDIKRACEKVQAKIVIIDPIMAHLDEKVNSWRDQDIRVALTPLCKMADEVGVAVIVVRHLNKASGAQAIYRGGGSIGIVGAARCSFLVAKDPDDERLRVFAGVKNNLAPMPPSLSFSVEGVGGASKVAWGGISSHGADALLAVPSSSKQSTTLDEAKGFLKDLLADGQVDAKEVQKEAASAGITAATLRRAKKVLHIRVEKQSFKGGWGWTLPQDALEVPKMLIQNGEHLRGEMSTIEKKEYPKPTEKALLTTEL